MTRAGAAVEFPWRAIRCWPDSVSQVKKGRVGNADPGARRWTRPHKDAALVSPAGRGSTAKWYRVPAGTFLLPLSTM